MDTDGQAGVGEGDPAELVRDAAGLDRAGLVATASGGGRGVLEGDVPPGQGGELTVCGRLVRLDHRDVVGLLGLDQPAGVRLGRVQSVESDESSVQVQRFQQGLVVRGLVRFRAGLRLGEGQGQWWVTAESRCLRAGRGAGRPSQRFTRRRRSPAVAPEPFPQGPGRRRRHRRPGPGRHRRRPPAHGRSLSARKNDATAADAV